MQARTDRRKEMRERFEERMAVLASPDFVARHVRPVLGTDALQAECKVEVVRNEGPPRLTLRYAFDGGIALYGKVYSDGSGPAKFSLLRQLWDNGFGPGSAQRVPEPLGFCAEENLLLMRAVSGRPLVAFLLHERIELAVQGVRAAARWLAHLHASPPAGIPCEPVCSRVKVFELADRLAKAAAGHPGDLGALLDRLQRLRTLAPVSSFAPVITHCQFTPANVFIDGSEVTAIDVDKLSLSDPAKDVALFVFRTSDLLARSARRTADAERLRREFVDTYREGGGQPIENVQYYIALFALKTFASCVKDRPAGDPVRRRVEARHLDLFERCCAGGAAPRTEPAARADGRRSAADTIVPVVTRYLTAHVPPLPRGDLPVRECQGTVVQNTGTGRVTIRCEVGAATVVFAKRYTDSLGAHSYEVQRTFWEGGFGADSRFRVPQPLAFLPEENLLLMRESRGAPLATFLGKSPAHWKAGVRRAARWLAAFHRSPLRVGDPEPAWDSLKTFRLATRLVKAAAAQPAKRVLLLDVMQMLKERLMDLPEGRPVVQTHGRFHHDHVFLGREAVTVIDLDRSRPADPAKDAAEFVRVLRLAAFRAGVEEGLIDKVTDAFLGQYLGLVPDAEAGLPHYWLSFLVLSYLGHLRKAVPDDRSAALTAFHEREIQRVGSRSA